MVDQILDFRPVLVRHAITGGIGNIDYRRPGLDHRFHHPGEVFVIGPAGIFGIKLDIPDNITIVPLPPKSPELNPVENIWQFMRENWLSNRIFKSYDDIVDHCCHAWNKLVDQPWAIMSIGIRDWAHGL